VYPSSDHLTDELLVLDWQSGDATSLRQLFDRWHPRLVRYARRLTGSDDAGADVAQEAWLAMVRGIRKLDDPRAFHRWAYQIVTRRAADWIRTRQRIRAGEGTQSPTPIDGLPSPDVGHTATESIDDADQVTVALARLPEKFRTVLVLRYLEDLGVSEIATILGEPVGTIKSRLHHAREALRPHLTEEEPS